MMINIKQIKGLFKELQDLWTAIKTKANTTTIDTHIADKTNPHGVTKSQVGLSNVNNTSDNQKPVSEATQKELDKKPNKDDLHKVATSGQYEDLEGKPIIPVVPPISKVGLSGQYDDLEGKPTIPTVPTLAPVATSGDYNDLENKPDIVSPTVDKTSLGLDKVNNTSDSEKPLSTPQQQALDKKVDLSDNNASFIKSMFNGSIQTQDNINEFFKKRILAYGFISNNSGILVYKTFDNSLMSMEYVASYQGASAYKITHHFSSIVDDKYLPLFFKGMINNSIESLLPIIYINKNEFYITSALGHPVERTRFIIFSLA